MPCADCSSEEYDITQLLCVDWDAQTLYCPSCRGLEIARDSQVNFRVQWLLEDWFTDEYILSTAKKYDKHNLILTLLHRSNENANISEEIQFPVNEFGYLIHITKLLLQESGFGNQYLQNPFEQNEDLQTLRDAYTRVIKELEYVKQDFNLCIGRADPRDHWSFFDYYETWPTEYKLCYHRCLTSLIGGDPSNRAAYNFISENFRDFDRPESDDIETLEDFGDFWYGMIQSLKFVASNEETVDDIYYTQLPESVDVFQLQDLLNRIDDRFTDWEHQQMQFNSLPAKVLVDAVDQIGEDIFDDWPAVRENIILSEDTVDAHPLLFELDLDIRLELRDPGETAPSYIPHSVDLTVPYIIYPRFWSRMVLFQLFPLLSNGDNRSSYKILRDLTEPRGKEFERNIYEYIDEKVDECFHSAEITRNNPREIDVLCVLDDTLTFIEVKYMMSPLRMSERSGVKELDDKFEYKVFKVDNGAYEYPPNGQSLPEKTSEWLDMEGGDTFWSQVSEQEGDDEEQVFQEEWLDLEVQQLVVSNLTPSYIEKEGVRFITDLELYKWLEHGEDVFWTIE
jgi:hypothetical protein